MLKIKIANTEIPYLFAEPGTGFIRGQHRNKLTVTCAADAADLGNLRALLTEENLESFTLTNTEGVAMYACDAEGNFIKDENGNLVFDHWETVTNTYEKFFMDTCGLRSIMVQKENADTDAVYEPRLVIELGQRTYTEQKQIAQEKRLAALEAALGL